MEKAGKPRVKHWKRFYKSNNKMGISSFCSFVCSKNNFSEKRILELCCGNGRDSYYLADRCLHLTGVDYAYKCDDRPNATFYEENIFDFLERSNPDDFDVVYCRFGLHSVESEVEDKILEFSKYIFFEFRSDKDKSFKPDHFRRLINGSVFLSKLLKKNFEIEFYIESAGLSVLKEQDPIIIRVIAKK